jgi:hypothetical protein
MIDAGHIKVHPQAVGARGGQSGDGTYKRGLNTRIHLAVNVQGMPIRVFYYVKMSPTQPKTSLAYLYFYVPYILDTPNARQNAIGEIRNNSSGGT